MPRKAEWDTSCKDWERRIMSGKSLVPTLPLFDEPRDRALKIFKLLRLPDVRGTPFIGDIGDDWIYRIVEVLFGSFDKDQDKRHVQEYFILVPKKNGKSTFAAAMMMTAIMMNKRPGAEFNFLAPTIEVAGISFRQARGMVKIDDTLSKLFHIQDNIRRITYKRSGAYLQIKAADTDIVTGGKPVGTLIDETHVFSNKSRAADIFIEIRGALAARPDGFLIQISTQSKAPPAGVFKSELARARDVRDGRLKLPKPLLPVIYELPRSLVTDGSWRDEKYWHVVNPNLGKSVDIDFLRTSLIDADRKGPGDIALLASQHFNVEIGMSLHADRWAGAEFWKQQTKPELNDIERLLERSEIVVVGIDGGGLDDLFGVCVLGRDAQTKDWLAWSHAWCHELVLGKRKIIAQQLEDFARHGELTIINNAADDITEIVDIISGIKERGILSSVAVDPAGIGEFVDALSTIQITPEAKNVVGAPQGYGMMMAIKTAERKLANKTLWHSDNSMMSWCVSNLKIEATATAIRATKQNAGDAKIDAAMAMFNAVTVMAQSPARAPEYQMFVLA